MPELERFDTAEQTGRIAYEHMHRYALCREYVAGKRVLDLACGTGYGTALLAGMAARADGIDISAAAVKEARRRHKSSGARYHVGNCFDLPFEAASFDVVVANEMIEHVDDHDGLIAEVRRVLVPGGLFLVSTPNKSVYNRYKAPNAFHVSEMELSEFRALLGRHFGHVALTGTRMALISAGYALDAGDDGSNNLAAARIFRGGIDDDGRVGLDMGELALADPEYLLAACSDAPLERPAAPSSLFYIPDQDLWLDHERIMAWASGLHEEDEALRRELREARAQSETDRAEARRLAAELATLAGQTEDLRTATRLINQAVDAERQTVARQAAQARALTARLVGQMARREVAEDDGAIVAALFDLNGELLLERHARSVAEREINSARSAAEREIAAANVTAHEARAAADQAKADAAAMAEQAAEHMARLTDMEGRIAQLASERMTAFEELRQTAQERDKLRANEASATARLAELEAMMAARDAALADTRAQLSALTAAHEQTAADRAAAADAAARLQADIAALQAEREALDARLASEVSRREERAATLEAELVRLRTEAAATAARHADEMAAATRERAALLARLDGAAGGNGSPATASASPGATRGRTPQRAPAVLDARARRQRQLAALHRSVQAELTASAERVRGRLPPPGPALPPPTLMQKLRGRRPAPETSLFDAGWVACVSGRKMGLAAYLADPAMHAVDPHPLFAAAWYLERHPDVAAERMSALGHYLRHGWREGRDPHPLFCNDWYLARNPDVLAAGDITPIDHYLRHGWTEGRWPNPVFDPRAYLERYGDVAAAGMEPLTHYVVHGKAEGREQQFRGRDPDWQPLLGGKPYADGLMTMLLRAAPADQDTAPAGDSPVLPAHSSAVALPAVDAAGSWPPEPIGDFWPEQTMRDHLLDWHGQETLDRLWYLFSVMARYQDDQAEFAKSEACSRLMAHAKALSAAHAAKLASSHDATVIIPVYNNIVDTLLSIVSVLELETRHSFDIIVADDGSSDATSALIPMIGGIVHHLRQPENLGFLGNCNAAAATAQGRHIILLNNDTLVLPGWLDGLLAPFATLADVGLVGSKLLNWDGTLQEAGGIFWRDGSAWNFGRNQNAGHPQFNYLKDVDYCSGASIAVPAHVWRAVGGFDPAYTPAYCEDSDLAFRLREAGYRTLYNPASEVIHHEGRSHGRDVASGVKSYQIVNQQRLFDRWHHVLERDHFPNAQNVLRARDRSGNRRHVLVVDHYVPQPDKDAGSRTIHQFITSLVQEGYLVTFWPDNLWRDPHYTARLQSLGVEVIYGPAFVDQFARFLSERADLYDAVLLSRPHIADHYIDEVRNLTKARIVYYGHDLHFRRLTAANEVQSGSVALADIAAMKATEIALCRKADVALFPNGEEAGIIGELAGRDCSVRAIPAYCFHTSEIAAARSAPVDRNTSGQPAQLLFVGGFNHAPNRDGLLWFCSAVWPQLNTNFKAALSVAGSNADAQILALSGDGIDVLGFVSDEELLRLYARADVVVAPLRYGAGVKGKVIEAMARGVPVVTTSVGAQGIQDASEMLLIADDADAFAAAIRRARKPDVAAAMTAKALNYIEQFYSTSAMTNTLTEALFGVPALHSAGKAGIG